jgi:hypothetical protein
MLLLHDVLRKSGQNEIYLKQPKARKEKKKRGEEKGQKRREEKRREEEEKWRKQWRTLQSLRE